MSNEAGSSVGTLIETILIRTPVAGHTLLEKHNLLTGKLIKFIILLNYNIENLFKNNQYIVFHIDDDVRVIKSMKNSSDINVVHISSLIE